MIKNDHREFEHGQYDVHVEANIIIFRLVGSFNDDGVRTWSTKLKEIVGALQGAPFCVLSNELEFQGGTPEAYEEGNKYNEWLNSQNMTSKAIVTQSEVLKRIQLQRIPSRSQQHIEYLDNEVEAKTWLRSQLNDFSRSKDE